jgi:hypothetical protein
MVVRRKVIRMGGTMERLLRFVKAALTIGRLPLGRPRRDIRRAINVARWLILSAPGALS